MQVLARRACNALALLTLFAPAFATTWIVDAANGPGTHFTDLPPAVAVAAPGDVILVKPGTYQTFTLQRGVSILGQGLVRIADGAVVSGVPFGELAVLRALRTETPIDEFRVIGCDGTVILQNTEGLLDVFGSADVRISGAVNSSPPFPSADVLEISASRVQLVQSNLQGGAGWPGDCGIPGDDGGSGIACFDATRLHVSRSTLRGGKGGDAPVICFTYGGSGGSGIEAFGSSGGGGGIELVLTGSSGSGAAIGGAPGSGGAGAGGAGYSLLATGGVTAWTSQMSYAPTPPWMQNGATLIVSSSLEPTLEMIGTPTPGATIVLRLRAEPGTVARLNLGRTPTVTSAPGVLVENLVLKERSFDLGTVPASGVVDAPWTFQPAAPAGKLLIFQAKVNNPTSGLTQKSNSIEAIVP